jgi:putative endonuclease
MLRCADGSIYTGISTDVDRRLREHNLGGRQGARYTRARLPVVLIYTEKSADRSSASKREAALRRLDHQTKVGLCSDP